jgi:hypothetical protein
MVHIQFTRSAGSLRRLPLKAARNVLVACGAAAGLALGGSAHAQSIQPGLWEFKHEVRMPGQPDLAALTAQMREQMNSLPPEVRQMMDQQLADLGVGFGADGALRLCIGPEEAQQGPIREGHTEGDCTFTQVRQAGNTWSGRVVCTEPASQGDFTTTLHSPSHFSTKAVMTSEEFGRVDMSSEARRVSADCGAIQPAGKR